MTQQEVFMLTTFILGLSVGILLSFLWMYLRFKRLEESEEYKEKTAMTTYRADVAVAAHRQVGELENTIRGLQQQNKNLIEFNRRLATAIDNGGKK